MCFDKVVKSSSIHVRDTLYFENRSLLRTKKQIRYFQNQLKSNELGETHFKFQTYYFIKMKLRKFSAGESLVVTECHCNLQNKSLGNYDHSFKLETSARCEKMFPRNIRNLILVNVSFHHTFILFHRTLL